MCVCVCVYMHVCVRVYMRVYVCMHVRACVYVCMRVHVCVVSVCCVCVCWWERGRGFGGLDFRVFRRSNEHSPSLGGPVMWLQNNY